MDIAGSLFQTVGQGIGGLVVGALRALALALDGVIRALQTALPGPWLPIVAVAALVLLGWSLVRR